MIQKVKIKIIQTSDVHGNFFPYDFINRKPGRGSLSRASTYIKRQREMFQDHLLLLENGDILQGQPTCYYSCFIQTLQTNLAADIVNYLKYDVQGIGNHDIETGHAVYDKWISELHCSTLAANIIDTNLNKPYTAPYTIIQKGEIKIAVLALTTPAIPSWLSKELWKGMRLENMVESAAHWIDHIKQVEAPHLVVGLFHSGHSGGIETNDYKENSTLEVAQKVDGFDIIFFGHDHKLFAQHIINDNGKEVLCLNPSSDALFLSEAEVTFTIDNHQVIDRQITGKNIDIRKEDIDTDFIKHFQQNIDEVLAFTNRKIGEFATTIYSRDSYFGSAAFTDFIHQVQLDVTHADISFNAPLAFDIAINQGDVHVSDLFNLYKYENQIYVLEMTGQEIKDYLEMSYGQWCNTMLSPQDHIMQLEKYNHNGCERTFFKHLTFNFDSAMGIIYTVDVRQPNGKKIKILSLENGLPFLCDKRYTVAMHSYRGNGGGELLTKGAGIAQEELAKRTILRSEYDQRYYLMKYIEDRKHLTLKANNNWKFIPEEWTIEAIQRDKELLFEKHK